MTQLAKTLDLFCEHYPAAFPHSEGMHRIGFAFRSRASNLRRWYGIKANTLITKEDKIAHGIDPNQKQAWYVLLESPAEARAKFEAGRVPTPGKVIPRKDGPCPISAHKNAPGAELAALRWAGHTPKRFKVAGREVTMKEYKAILAEKKQGVLL